ncbi:MAG: hypothetical protein M3014_13280 [Chloroflexota bacterium]|nr:hypothetical protein [Chloroflexota bacterium]
MVEDVELVGMLVGVLQSMDVPYMIGGSVALSAWARPRMTHDLDIVVDLPAARIAEFCAYFVDERFYIDSDAMLVSFGQRDRPSTGMYSFIDMETALKVDLFPLRNDPAQREAMKRRMRAEVAEGVEADVYAPDDLLVQKLRWYTATDSERQFGDCLYLLVSDKTRQEPLIDLAYVEGWVEHLGPEVREAWERLKAALRLA